MPAKKSAPARPQSAQRAAQAFAEAKPHLDRLTDDELRPINVDIPTAVATVLGALPNLRALRDDIKKKLPDHPQGALDDLETFAMAAWHAHLQHMPRKSSNDEVKALLAEAAPLRESLLVAAEALAHRKLLDAERVAEIRSGQGNVDTASDLVALAALFEAEWPRIKGKTAVDLDEVHRASELGPELLAALGVREHALPAPSREQAARDRQRAFTLLARAYEECRRAVAYLRWYQGDADDIAPSLAAHRRGNKAAEPVAPPAPPAPAG